jgi:hypothetical protein
VLIPEAILLTTLRNGFATLAQDVTALSDLFEDSSALDISRVQSVLASKRVNIILGFPQATTKGETIALTLGAMDEAEQPVGAGWQGGISEIGGGEFFQEVESSFFTSTWRITVYSTNGDLAVVLANIVKWILLTQRAYLTQAGLSEQRLAMGDFEPTPAYLPDVMYVRAVMLSAKVRETYTTTIPFTPITEINVDIQPTLFEGAQTPVGDAPLDVWTTALDS